MAYGRQAARGGVVYRSAVAPSLTDSTLGPSVGLLLLIRYARPQLRVPRNVALWI